MKLTSDEFLKFDLLNPDIGKKGLKWIHLLSKVRSTLQVLIDMPAFPQAPDSIFRSELPRAVGATTAMEGNTLTQEEIEVAFDKADKNITLQRLEQEVQNSREVYLFLADEIHGEGIRTISKQLLSQVHSITTKNLPYLGNSPGAFRATQVRFGYPLLPSLFPDQASVERAVSGFIDWYVTPATDSLQAADPYIKALMAHYYLSEIHPFVDGNGRTTRAVEAFCLLCDAGVPRVFFYVLANYWTRNREQYLAELRGVRENAEASSWVEFGLRGMVEEFDYLRNKVIAKTNRLMFNDYVHYLNRTRKPNPNIVGERMMHVLELLVEVGKTPLKDFQGLPSFRLLYYTVSQSTRSRDLKKLVENNLVSITSKNDVSFIEPNFGLLRTMTYA